MITRFGSVPIFVSDQSRSLEFFRDKVGLEVILDQRYGPTLRWVTVALHKGATEIVLFRPVPAIVGAGAEELQERIGTWTGIVFLTDDISTTYRELLERGVDFLAAPKLQPWGAWETQFTDPDGNSFHLAQRPENV